MKADLLTQIRLAGLPEPQQEYEFCPDRQWRFDYFWPNLTPTPLALEIEGGVWTSGRHVHPTGFLGDIEKYNQAALMGYRLIRVTPQMIDNGEALTILKRHLIPDAHAAPQGASMDSTLPLAEIIVGERHRKEMGNIAALAISIREVGLLQPLVVRPDKTLVAGQRRLLALQQLEWREAPVRIVDNLSDLLTLLKAERDENTCREPFVPSEAVALGKDIEDHEEAKAKERQKKGGKEGGKKAGRGRPKKDEQASGKFPETCSGTSAEPGDTRDKVGKALGMDGRTYEKAKQVVDAANDDPDLFGDLVEQMDRTRKVDPAFKEMNRRQETGSKEKKPEPWDIALDFGKIRAAVERCSKRWTTRPYRVQAAQFLEQLAMEIRDGGS